ncbi:class I SAM-dependent methyltransferase [Paludibacterium purpuratum]|uniref:Methyltransferase family protein n=1 Tax=Paludibacterium purpuratum TaxID=1144873 RepID=A0A4R7BBK8_9NEIS|nr:class I SAM-dependent methyltransferase [Paludibacterium purpuratum]TDR81462.1 methyltransferase family protein [Paludibacterium purpuratum]
MSVQSFDEFYRGHTNLYGLAPMGQLVHYMQTYSVRGPGLALDLGCGQGRNAFHLARCGYDVTAVDCSGVAIAQLRQHAADEKLSIQGVHGDIAQFPIQPFAYRLIVANTSLDHLAKDDGLRMAQAMVAGLAPGGYLYAAVFLDDDPGCSHLGSASETAGHIRHYYRSGELRETFEGLTLLSYQEEWALDLSHGEPHYHSTAFLFARHDD